MKIKLLASERSERGPGMVYKNLRKGLEALDIEVADYPVRIDEECEYTVSLSHPAIWEKMGVQSDSICAIGPNIWEIPEPAIAMKYSDIIVPSQWVKTFYETFDCMKEKNIHIWPVGIDTKEWSPSTPEDKKGDCLIYYKSAPRDQLDQAVEMCMKAGLTFGILEYGKYHEDALREAVQQCKFCILVTRTESQGIAYLQILSAGLPCFVFEKEVWDDRSDGISCPATAVPYFSEACGVKISQSATLEEKQEKFSDFLDSLRTFAPREYVTNNLGLKDCAKKFVDILESTNE